MWAVYTVTDKKIIAKKKKIRHRGRIKTQKVLIPVELLTMARVIYMY